MSGGGRKPPDDSGEAETRQTTMPTPSPDEQPTGAVADLGVVAELRAVFATGEKKTLPLYAMADQVVVGRGTACDWQLDDASLSRRHAQFKWSGSQGALTVEDLGSANGTRVSGRPARNAIPVKPGEPVQLGTVVVTLEPRGAPRAASPDDQATRLVAQPAVPEDLPSDPGLPPMVAAATVIRPSPPPGAPNAQAQLFRPERDAARPDEPTRSWDTRAVLVRAPERDAGELMDRLKHQWRTNRRPFVLLGASGWIGLLLLVWTLVEKPPVEEEPFGGGALPQVKAPPRSDRPAPPDPPPANANANVNVNANANEPLDADDQLEKAVAAYDQGHLADALALFRKLAGDPKNAAARFMVELIESRVGAKP